MASGVRTEPLFNDINVNHPRADTAQVKDFTLSLCFNNNNNNNNLLHLYSTFLDTQSALHSKGAISSSTTNVQHPPG